MTNIKILLLIIISACNMCVYGMNQNSFLTKITPFPWHFGVEDRIYTIDRAESGDIVKAQEILEAQIKTGELDIPIYLMFKNELETLASSSLETQITLQLKASLNGTIVGYASHVIVKDDLTSKHNARIKHKSLLKLMVCDKNAYDYEQIFQYLKLAPKNFIKNNSITESRLADNIAPIEAGEDTIGYWPLSEFEELAN